MVWIYDEKGYPAVGRAAWCSRRIPSTRPWTWPTTLPARSVHRAARLRVTHASNNYHAARRYINLIDERAVRSFIDKTHEAYRRCLRPLFGTTIQATFTDEPSLDHRQPRADPGERAQGPGRGSDRPEGQAVTGRSLVLRPAGAVPGALRRGPDAAASQPVHRRHAADGRVRRRFWSLIADLVAERYFGAIQDWCGSRIASSGHNLWEEAVLHHAALRATA